MTDQTDEYVYTIDPIVIPVDQLHCLNCQAPGVVVDCPTDDDKSAFVARHKDCTYP